MPFGSGGEFIGSRGTSPGGTPGPQGPAGPQGAPGSGTVSDVTTSTPQDVVLTNATGPTVGVAASGGGSGQTPDRPAWLKPAAWLYLNLPVAGFTIDAYTYANGTAGVGATVTQNTPADGALSIDGGTPSVGDRVAFADASGGYPYCGVYTVTAVGDGATVPWVLTRATDNDTAATLMQYWAVPVIGTGTAFSAATVKVGSLYGSTVGTDPIDLLINALGGVAGGLFATAADYASVAFGRGATAKGGTALGPGAQAGSNGIAIGNNAVAPANATNIGGSVASTATSAVNLGANTITGTGFSAAYGDGNTSSNGGMCWGQNCSANNVNAYAVGLACIANGDYSIATGQATRADLGGNANGVLAHAWAWGYWAVASSAFAEVGDSQYAFWMPYNQTTDATPTLLGVVDGATTPGAPNQLALTFPDFKHTCLIEARVVARRTDTPGTVSVWECNNIVVDGNGSSAYRIVGTPTVSVVQQDSAASGWAVAFGLTGGNDGFQITVTGEAGNTIQWTCTLKVYEVAG